MTVKFDTDDERTPRETAAIAGLRARIQGSGVKICMDLVDFTDGEGNTLPLLDAVDLAHSLLDRIGIPKATRH